MPIYWIAQWVDENEIRSDWEIAHCMSSLGGIQSLLERAEEAYTDIRQGRAVRPDESVLADAIVAGRKLDLSGRMSCFAYECMRQDIDESFKRVWHYFDNIIVEGLSPLSWFNEFQAGPDDHRNFLLHAAEEQARLLLYLRAIGADKFTIHAHKTFSFCQEHWLQHAKELGISAALDDKILQSTVRAMTESSEVTIEPMNGGGWAAQIYGGYLSGRNHLLIHGNKRPSEGEVVASVLSGFATATISDVELARRLALPLLEPTTLKLPGSTSKRSRKSRKAMEDHDRESHRISDVALNLHLPVFDRLTTKDFLKIREDERPGFESFRSALRLAIRDKLSSSDADVSPATIARTIDEEYLRPGLADIERRLRTSRQAVLKKTAVDLSIGAAAAGVAAIASVPLMITGGVAALGSSVPLAPAIHAYIEDTRSAKMSDLYFLWQISKHAGH